MMKFEIAGGYFLCIASVLFFAVGCAPLRKVDGGGRMELAPNRYPRGLME
jgi:hypothetical protein